MKINSNSDDQKFLKISTKRTVISHLKSLNKNQRLFMIKTLNSDCQKFHRLNKNEQSLLTSNH